MAPLSWLLPTPLLVGVGAALPRLAFLPRRPLSLRRMVGAAFITALAVIAAVWREWVARWLLPQRC